MYGQQQNKEESLKLSLYMAFTYVIWNLRNQILDNGGQANITATTRNIENRFQEFAYAMESEKPFRVVGDAGHRAQPINLNVDAKIFQEFSTLAVVARDDNGEFIQV